MLIAVGSSPVVPPVPGLAAVDPLTTDSVWDLSALPERLLVLGGGPIGCELRQAFTRLGSQVTIVEQGSRLLAREDPEVGELLARRLTDEGARRAHRARVAAVEPARGAAGPRRPGSAGEGTGAPGGPWRVRLEGAGGGEVLADRVLVAAGRRPRTAGLGLERAGVKLEQGGAVGVDTRLRTSARGVYAAGDVTGILPFTHVAAQ